jgi:hypothetical protein
VRRAAKSDTAQLEIVRKLRSCGVTVDPRISRVGQGVPDLLCGFRGRNILLEVKTGARDCDRKLTQDEQDWHASWAGQVAVVSDWEEAMRHILEATA